MNPLNNQPTQAFRPLFLAGALATALLTGCATTTAQDPYAQTKRGAMIGAAVGGAAGLFVGDGELDEVLGGAAVGAGVGAGIGVYMDRQQRALEQIDGAQVERVDEDTLKVSFDSDILFAVDSAQLSGTSLNDLDAFAQVMQQYPKTAILIQGHTDTSGSVNHNQALSERRAASVEGHLARKHVDPSRMAAYGYGESLPVADNSTAWGRQQNRRVNILIRGKA